MPPLTTDDLLLLRNVLAWLLLALAVAWATDRWRQWREQQNEMKPKRAPVVRETLTAGEIVRRQELRRAHTHTDARG